MLSSTAFRARRERSGNAAARGVSTRCLELDGSPVRSGPGIESAREGTHITNLLTFGLSLEQEERYRRASLDADMAQARLCVQLGTVPVVALWFNDYVFFGLSGLFFAFTALRLGLLAGAAVLLRHLRRVSNPAAYDRAVAFSGLAVAMYLSLVAASRPHTYWGHLVVTVVVAFIALMVVPNRFAYQVAVSGAVSAGEVLAIPFREMPTEMALVAVVSLILVTVVGAVASWQIHFHRRRAFLAHELVEDSLRVKETLVSELQEALAGVRRLKGLLPICMYCHKIRDDKGYWNRVEEYIRAHSEAEFSHGLCPECLEQHFPGLGDDHA